MPLYTISYDLKTKEEPLTNEQFRRIFVEFLLKNGASYIKSYNNSTILFNSIIEFNDMAKLIHRASVSYVYYQFSEVKENTVNKYNCVRIFDTIHVSNFDDLVIEIRDLME